MSNIGNRLLSPHKKNVRVESTDPFAVQKIRCTLNQMLEDKYQQPVHQLVVLCIGTDRSTGDALGPLIGTKLGRLQPRHAAIFGTLDEPVHAVNLAETIDKINNTYPSPLIIAVDACLGRMESVGSIDIGIGPMKPGAGVNKELPAVGEIHINGIVNVGGFLEYFVLQNTRLSVVVRLAETIARGLYFSLQSLPRLSSDDSKKQGKPELVHSG
ncbi:spore protease YyaC [Dethiobacter alkaliphilus]|uniref:Sporulation protein YyaC n=1 Tax=Dethiobacter alkaliphilus AHT 1 TaxID=555088 RepID=C0GI87_DETAL|nr:spore protease YyaC [Dethiobacter alkaliphilus]EEG76935.1 sporulation protein YyaC [Dethiobacter alkaliphilus AHT 1]